MHKFTEQTRLQAINYSHLVTFTRFNMIFLDFSYVFNNIDARIRIGIVAALAAPALQIN